jgi:hypothetical protein
VIASLARAAARCRLLGVLLGAVVVVGCGEDGGRADCEFSGSAEKSLERLRDVQRCLQSRPITLRDMKAWVGAPRVGNRGSSRAPEWVYSVVAPEKAEVFSRFCDVTVRAKDRTVVEIEESAACE